MAARALRALGFGHFEVKPRVIDANESAGVAIAAGCVEKLTVVGKGVRGIVVKIDRLIDL